jgi:hypothetical protein
LLALEFPIAKAEEFAERFTDLPEVVPLGARRRVAPAPSQCVVASLSGFGVDRCLLLVDSP